MRNSIHRETKKSSRAGCVLASPLLFLLVLAAVLVAAEITITGELWRDDRGNPLNAHEHDISLFGGVYYLYGSNWAGNPKGLVGVNAPVRNGITVYSSTDLRVWHYEGVALKVMGWAAPYTYHRPHVLYNEQNAQYVMWLYVYSGYPNQAGVAVAKDPVGPFTLFSEPCLTSSPNYGACADMNVFKDDDGKAYLIFDEGGFNIRIDELTEDYLASTHNGSVVMAAPSEAPAMVKYRGTYMIVSSGVCGWGVSPTKYALSAAPLGPYTTQKMLSDLAFEENSDHWRFRHQSTDLVYIPVSDRVMFCGDSWWNAGRGEDLNASHHVWLPVRFSEDRGQAWLEYPETWDPLTPETDVVPPVAPGDGAVMEAPHIKPVSMRGSVLCVDIPGTRSWSIRIVDGRGRTVYSRRDISARHLSIPVDGLGIYVSFVWIRSADMVYGEKILLLPGLNK